MRDAVDLLVGRWIHAHEEDDATHQVFRRAGTPLPPSRGRTEIEIGPDLTARRISPGPDDRPVVAPGYRIVFGDRGGPASAGAELKVAAVTADRLLVDKG